MYQTFKVVLKIVLVFQSSERQRIEIRNISKIIYLPMQKM